MFKKTALILCVGLTLSSIIGIYRNRDNFAVTKVEAASYTVGEISDFLQDKREHYPLSDEFIERYQQTSGGYIAYAKKNGVLVDKTQHSPNQKWHYFDSWLAQSLQENPNFRGLDGKTKVYTGLLCPELLLWLYEAMGVDPAKIREAKVIAEDAKVKGTNVSTMAKSMREVVSWEEFSKNLG